MGSTTTIRILLEDSALLDGERGLRLGAEVLLRRLAYSNLHVALCYQEDDESSQMAGLLKETADLYSFECISPQSVDQLMLEWDKDADLCICVNSRVDEVLFDKLQSHKWKSICVGVQDYNKMEFEVLNIGNLQELLVTICRLIKKESDESSVVTVGYVMKPSREEDFAKRGALPSSPTHNGLMFVPLSFELSLASQLQEFDMIVHKVTDQIISIDPTFSSDFPEGISFSAGMSDLLRFTEENPEFCIVDPFKSVYPLLDRLQIQQILHGLQELPTQGSSQVRPPHFLKVESFDDTDLPKQLSKADLSFPTIVKPQVACGVADAHNMAVVFNIEEFSNLAVPRPAILQEYVDHGSKMFKFYVLGDKVFHSVKKSMPNASYLKSSAEKCGGGPLNFNSLKSLPVATKDHLQMDRPQDHNQLDIDLVKEAAKWLQKQLELTIFGFDVVVQEGSGDHVIVDLNYLPSFKEVPDSEAMPAFWDAIKKAYDQRRVNHRQT